MHQPETNEETIIPLQLRFYTKQTQTQIDCATASENAMTADDDERCPALLACGRSEESRSSLTGCGQPPASDS